MNIWKLVCVTERERERERCCRGKDGVYLKVLVCYILCVRAAAEQGSCFVSTLRSKQKETTFTAADSNIDVYSDKLGCCVGCFISVITLTNAALLVNINTDI